MDETDAPHGSPDGVAPAADHPPSPDALSFQEMVFAALRAGADTGHGIARELDRLWPGFLHRREGYVYPVLIELWREGRIEAAWRDRPEGRRRVWSVAGRSAAERKVDEPPAAPPPLHSTVLETAAARVTRGLGFAPRLEEETRAEILGHLEDATRSYRALGRPREEAERQAVKELGDQWKLRTDLRRAARGKRTVIFPRTAAEHLLGISIYDVRVLLFIVAAIIFVRFQVVTAYHIPTKSMEPTLHGDPENGDRILVNKLGRRPDRFDIVVFDGWQSERKNFVKRAVGLPGETVEIHSGDLYVDGRLVRKDGSAYEALLFGVFDMEDLRAYAARKAAQDGESPEDRLDEYLREDWIRDSGEWVPHADALWISGTSAPDGPAELSWGDRIDDGIYDPRDAETGGGSEDVGDVRVTAWLHAETPDGVAGIVLTHGDEEFEAVASADGSPLTLRIGGQVVAEAPGVFLEPGKSLDLRLSHVDRVVRVDVAGRTLLRHELPEPEFPGHLAPRAGVGLRVHRGSVSILPVRIERDIHWTSGEYDAVRRVELGPDEYFMLGDNSGNSQDSRARGPVHTNRLVGKPLIVIWPFDRIRIPR